MHLKSAAAFANSDYAVLAGLRLIDAIPKTVWAAMVVSFIVNHEANEGGAAAVRARILHEWELLRDQRLVAQKPTAAARRAAL